ITKKHQSQTFRDIGRNIGGNSPTHGFSANDEPFWLLLSDDVFDDRAIPCPKFRLRIRHAAFRIHVFEIELDGMETTFCKLAVKIAHEGRIHSLPCAMSQDDGRFRSHARFWEAAP